MLRSEAARQTINGRFTQLAEKQNTAAFCMKNILKSSSNTEMIDVGTAMMRGKC